MIPSSFFAVSCTRHWHLLSKTLDQLESKYREFEKQIHGNTRELRTPKAAHSPGFVKAATSMVRRCLEDFLEQQAQHQHQAECYVPLDGVELEALDSFGLCRGATAASA